MATQDELAEQWDQLAGADTYRVLDEDGENMAGAMARKLDTRENTWLYVDEVDGYRVIDAEDIQRLRLERI